jgi:mono/diheme cytochrome c family protein
LVFTSGGISHGAVVPTLALHVAASESPDPFLPPGPFVATWTGFINADIRSDYLFQAEVAGEFQLEVNGKPALRAEAPGGQTPWSAPVRLTKGPNPIRATYRSPGGGTGFVRLQWAEKPFLAQPVPGSVLTHSPSPDLAAAVELSLGREWMLELRCLRCHGNAPVTNGIPELAMDAPSLEGIGSRRGFDWMRRWIENPQALRPGAHMPRVFQGPGAAADARAAAAYLASLQETHASPMSEPPPWRSLTPPPAAEAGGGGAARPLFETLHCAACHTAPDAAASEADKIPLSEVNRKFPAGRLEEFLRQPSAHYAWIRMPNFRLTASEAATLAGWLKSAAPAAGGSESAPSDAALIATGRRLIEEAGCLRCHGGTTLKDRHAAPTMASFTKESWTRGCLAASPASGTRAPDYGLQPGQRQALAAFGRGDLQSLRHHAPMEFASRSSRLLRCTACHGQFEGFPAFEILGAKLRPEWAASFVAGEVPYKPRAERHPKGEPWLAARMPAFGTYARPLTSGLAALNGFAPSSPEPGPLDAAAAAVGRKLVGKVGGFSCVSCHGVNTMPALEVFESEGINLALTGSRIRREYFDRWMRLPLAVDPQTKMPAYFDDEGHSPLTEVFEGDAVKQLEALWQYIRMGEGMNPPSLGDGGQ